MHQKHSNITKAQFGNFSRNEVAILGLPCTEIKIFFNKVIDQFPNKRFAIVEADHKAEESLETFTKYTDKINFQRIDSHIINSFDNKIYFENCDLTLVNGNHFLGKKQIIFIDSRKPLDQKLEKLTDVVLIVTSESEIPEFLKIHFGEKIPPILKLEEEKEIFSIIENKFLTNIPPLFGLVLAGGKSTRMGFDKGDLKYHGQQNQKEYAFALLNKYCEKVFHSLNESQIETSTQDYIQDSFLGIGPMGGILSAFQKYPDSAWLTIACDMPFLTEKSIEQLVNERNTSKIATAFKSPENELPEPLITIWEPKAYAKLLQMLAFGYDCPRKTLINSDIELIRNSQPIELQNVNNQEEYERAIINLSPKFV